MSASIPGSHSVTSRNAELQATHPHVNMLTSGGHDLLQIVSPGDSRASTPCHESRREGFIWEAPRSDEAPEPSSTRPIHPTPPIPRTPPTLEQLHRANTKVGTSGDEWFEANDPIPLTRSSTRKSSTASFQPILPSRADTNRASISGLARGMMRHVPDIHMFIPEKKIVSGRSEGNTKTQLKSRDGRGDHAQTELKSRVPTSDNSERSTPGSASPPKTTLKARRRPGLDESLKLRLPLGLPGLPARSRAPISEASSILPSRPRSPKTPWIQIAPPEWPISAPPTITEVEEPIFAFNNEAAQSQERYPEIPQVRPPDHPSASSNLKASDIFSFGEEEQNAKRECRVLLPLAGRVQKASAYQTPETRNPLDSPRSHQHDTAKIGIDRPEAISPSERSFHFPMPRFLRSKRRSQRSLKSPPHNERGGQSTTLGLGDLDQLRFPSPSDPPRLKRVNTSHLSDGRHEVKGKLADFSFDVHELGARKVQYSPGGFWDSDAILMPQATNLSQSSSESGESPQRPKEDSPPSSSLFPLGTPQAYSVHPSSTPEHRLVDTSWYHPSNESVHSKDPAILEAEEIARLEWLIPEHLPSSPLCPLHQKYTGPMRGNCVYHGRRTLLVARSVSHDGQLTRTPTVQVTGGEKKTRFRYGTGRDSAERQKSHLDGSEDAEERCASSRGKASSKTRNKKWWLRIGRM